MEIIEVISWLVKLSRQADSFYGFPISLGVLLICFQVGVDKIIQVGIYLLLVERHYRILNGFQWNYYICLWFY